MAKRDFVSLVFASIAALALSASAWAQDDFVGTDGCAVLAKIAYTEVRRVPGTGRTASCRCSMQPVSRELSFAAIPPLRPAKRLLPR